MDFRQLQTFVHLIDNDFNVSVTAAKSFLVQSAVSQQIKRMEQTLEFDLFTRKGKRLTGLTPLGKQVEIQARAGLLAFNNISRIADDARSINQNLLRIGCTHTQARYILPPVIRLFNQTYPDIELQIHQGNPQQLVEWANSDKVDFSICTEELAQSQSLESIPCYQWNRSLITRPGHPLLDKKNLTLNDLCAYPIVTYVAGFTGRRHFDDSFRRKGLQPNTVLSAADTDIIKAYVLDGLGIGIIASMAYDPQQDQTLVARDLSHLFPAETSRIAYQKDRYLRRTQQTFINLFLQAIQLDDSKRYKAIPIE